MKAIIVKGASKQVFDVIETLAKHLPMTVVECEEGDVIKVLQEAHKELQRPKLEVLEWY